MSVIGNFHEGELRLQRESGVDSVAFDSMVEGAFRPQLTETEVRFVSSRSFSIAATVDSEGRPWASPLFGRSGELFRVIDATTVLIRSDGADGDPFAENIDATGELGVLYFDPSRRRRATSMGHARLVADGEWKYRMNRNFGLCNKYIFKRNHDHQQSQPGTDFDWEERGSLDARDRAQLSEADTSFLATHHGAHGADASHRGGPAGFITVVGDATISMPDYTGNGMFQTLGNLLIDDRIGLMTVDFSTGRTIHITGRGAITESPASDEYSARTLTISVDDVRVTFPNHGTWTDVEAFKLRPGLINPATPYI